MPLPAYGQIPLLAFTPIPAVRSHLAISWGVETFQTEESSTPMVRQVDEQLLEIGRVQEGDLDVIIAGSPPGIPGSTNALRIHRMGDAITTSRRRTGEPDPIQALSLDGR